MDSKNRISLAVSISLLIILAIVISFGRSLLDLEDTPRVSLPPPPIGQGDVPGPGADGGDLQWLAVTPQTVQAVIGSLIRLDSYYQEISSELFWAGGSGVSLANVYVQSGWTRLNLLLPSGLTRNELIGGGTAFTWYEGSRQWFSAPAGERAADLAQQIPTYETVLQLKPDLITAAEYQELDGVPVIYVEMQVEQLNYLERYWVGVESGLLLSAETEKDKTIVYRMTTVNLESPCPDTLDLTLPDGTRADIAVASADDALAG